MAIKQLRPGLILLASALPLITRFLLTMLTSEGLLDPFGVRLLFMPLDVCLFGIGFSVSLLVGTGLSTQRISLRAVLFCFSILCVNAALLIGYTFLGMFLMIGAAAFLAPALSGGAYLTLYGYFMGRFLGFSVGKNSYIRLFILGAITNGAQLYAIQIFSPEFGLQLTNSAWYLAAGLALYFESTLGDTVPAEPVAVAAPRRKRSGLSLKVGLALAFVPPLVLSFLLAAGIFYSFDGYCYGFTDGKWSCSVWESLGNQLGFGLFFLSVPAFGWIGLVLFMTDFRNALRQGA